MMHIFFTETSTIVIIIIVISVLLVCNIQTYCISTIDWWELSEYSNGQWIFEYSNNGSWIYKYSNNCHWILEYLITTKLKRLSKYIL